jgi:subtilisin family serine protease
MIGVAPDLPWQPARSRGAMRGRVIVRLAPGEAPSGLPHQLEVARGLESPPLTVDGGRLDATVRRHSPALRAMNAFGPAGRVGGGSERRWSDLEEELGFSRTLRIDVDPDADLLALTSDLEALGVVEQVSPAFLSVTPFQDPQPSPVPKDRWYAHEMIGAREALDYEPGDSALICAVVDSGVDLHHAELEESLRPGMDTVDLGGDHLPRSMRLVGDYSGVDRVPMDMVGHGTACAAIIGGRGVSLPVGLGGAVKVLPLRALAGAQMVGRNVLTALGSLLDIDLAVKLAVDLGARVLNLSFGTPETSLRERDPRPHASVVEYARRRGCVLVAASGNSGSTVRYYPSCLDGVIAVGSVGPEGTPSGFTSRGDHVDLCAPGESVPSAGVGGYQLNTGTSFAAPFVAGACALLLARAARYGHPLDGGSARELLMRTARPFPRGADKAGCGAGILDVPAALKALEGQLAGGPVAVGEEEAAVWATPVRETRATARAP